MTATTVDSERGWRCLGETRHNEYPILSTNFIARNSWLTHEVRTLLSFGQDLVFRCLRDVALMSLVSCWLFRRSWLPISWWHRTSPFRLDGWRHATVLIATVMQSHDATTVGNTSATLVSGVKIPWPYVADLVILLRPNMGWSLVYLIATLSCYYRMLR